MFCMPEQARELATEKDRPAADGALGFHRGAAAPLLPNSGRHRTAQDSEPPNGLWMFQAALR